MVGFVIYVDLNDVGVPNPCCVPDQGWVSLGLTYSELMNDRGNGCGSIARFLASPDGETTVFVLLVLLGYELYVLVPRLGRKSIVIMICRCSVDAEVLGKGEGGIICPAN